MIVEPWYPVAAQGLLPVLSGKRILSVGVPVRFAMPGTVEEIDERNGLDAGSLRKAFEEFCNG
jgi:hypothetical protein